MEKFEKLTWKDYMGLSIRTLSKLIDNYSIIHTYKTEGDVSTNMTDMYLQLKWTLDRVHCAMGIVSETQELIEAIDKNDIVNIGEELADKCWYLSGLLYVNNNYEVDYGFDYTFQPSPVNNLSEVLEQLYASNHYIIDSAKKELAYGDANKITHLTILSYLIMINQIADLFDINMNEALAKNINKLYVRFPDKFTSENAIYRDIAAERKVL